jgi:hypothetical protein
LNAKRKRSDHEHNDKKRSDKKRFDHAKSAAENVVRSISKSRAAASSADTSAKTKVRKRKTTRPLKKHYQYIIPQYRLILVKEPGIKPTQITDALSFHHFIQPLTQYSEEHFIAFPS